MQRQFDLLREPLTAAVNRVCQSGRFIFGPDCESLENALAAYCGAKHALGCASGSDALLLALMAYEIGSGDEVLLPSYTFFATASAVWRLGATPVFVDIDPVSYNLDPLDLARKISPRTKAVIPVHLYGQCADMEPIMRIAQAKGIPVIEDACQAIGAKYDHQSAGSIGDIGCFSFYPTKNLGGFGDGGLLTAQTDALAHRLKLLRAHGMEPRYYHQLVGINSRLDTLQAAVLNVKMPHLEQWTEQRAANAARYGELFAGYRLERVLTLPTALPKRRHVWNQYIIRVPDGKRDALRQHLTDAKIGTEIYYPVPLHQQACFAALGYGPNSLPHSERAATETLALPIFPELTAAEQHTVVARIGDFFGVRAATGGSAASTIKRPKFLDKSTERRSA
jgi:dTDP-4-amino-4,6-dideoxygalactose transaminase